MESPLQQKTAALAEILRSIGPVLVAYSGGVDSTLLAAAVKKYNPQPFLAVTAESPLMAKTDFQYAKDLAAELELPWEALPLDMLILPQVRNNHPRRCYYCKKALYLELQKLAKARGLEQIADGANADDLKIFRPGNNATAELGIRRPLAEAGFTKAEVRALAEEWGLPNYNRPSLPCLATRFPYHTPLDYVGLYQVEQGEDFLRANGFPHCRLRNHGDQCRLELPREDWSAFLAREELIPQLETLGWNFLTLDLKPLRSGSFDE